MLEGQDDDYIDPKFEQPWIRTAKSLQENIQLEKIEIAKVRKVTRNHRYCEDLSFNPWNNVPEEHRPLGIVQRMKREVYAGSRDTRFKENPLTNAFIQ